MPSEPGADQPVDFDAQVRNELLALHRSTVGSCAACGAPVRVEENFMRVDGRVAHVSCRQPMPPVGPLRRAFAPARAVSPISVPRWLS